MQRAVHGGLFSLCSAVQQVAGLLGHKASHCLMAGNTRVDASSSHGGEGRCFRKLSFVCSALSSPLYRCLQPRQQFVTGLWIKLSACVFSSDYTTSQILWTPLIDRICCLHLKTRAPWGKVQSALPCPVPSCDQRTWKSKQTQNCSITTFSVCLLTLWVACSCVEEETQRRQVSRWYP